jgi:hypothetical protein
MNACRHPRTTAEAFPQSCEYACAVERPAHRPYPRVLWIALACGFVAALIAART